MSVRNAATRCFEARCAATAARRRWIWIKTLTENRIKRWSQQVNETSNALDLERGVFSWDDPKRIARSLQRSAEDSNRRKAPAFQSAMSMLNFYINRAGRKLPQEQREVLERAKEELRGLYGRTPRSGR